MATRMEISIWLGNVLQWYKLFVYGLIEAQVKEVTIQKTSNLLP